MKILCFQHHDDEHAGYLRGLLARDGHTLTTVMLHRSEPIPDVAQFDALWVLGGPMDVWQVREHPWLKEEIEAIRVSVCDLKQPFFGLCLGHQLLAVALGGEVAPGKPEIGVMPVTRAPSALSHAVMHGVPEQFDALQWHSAEIVSLPPSASVLASSEACSVQAIQVDDHALSFQFHLEAEQDTVASWGAVPAYRDALVGAMGCDGLQILESSCAKSLSKMNALCERLYSNWMAMAGGHAHASV